MEQNVRGEIGILSRAKYPILAVESYEEQRAIKLFSGVARDQGKDIFCWSMTEGIKGRDGSTIGNTAGNPDAALAEVQGMNADAGAFVILKDFHPYMKDPIITRRLRDLHNHLKGTRKTLVLLSPQVQIPQDLQKSITIVDLPLPGYDEMSEILADRVCRMQERKDALYKRVVDAEQDNYLELAADLKKEYERVSAAEKAVTQKYEMCKDKLVQALLGLTLDEADNVIARNIVQHDLNLKVINQEKRQIIRKSGMLEYFDAEETMQNVGGLEVLKQWTRRAAKRFSAEAKDFGLEAPRGILLVGPPGTGKSLSAKAIANVMQIPLLKFDMGAATSSLYGQTTQNAIGAFKLAEATAPVVFWIDEIEKGMASGQGGGDQGHEETNRTTGAMLTRWEESKAAVFKIATSNSPFNLKAEIMQRFEKTFFVDLPQKGERKDIFAIQIAAVRRNPVDFNLMELATATEGYVGREIRTIVREALAVAFDEGTNMTVDHMLAEAKRMTPMAVQKKKQIEALRAWAKSNAINASVIEQQAQATREVDF